VGKDVDALDGVSATVAARRLGVVLRNLRQRLKTLRVLDVAKAAGVSQPTWSQVETGVAIPTEEHLVAAMRILEADEETIVALLSLRQRAKRVEWWHEFADVGSQSYLKYIGYEASAVKLRMCSSGWVPGLLQTSEWARAIMLMPGVPIRPENVDRTVELRIRRQAVLDKPAFRLHAVCGEEALRYQVGGRDVQFAQFHHLLAIAKARNRVTLQVTPFSGPLHLGHSTPYTLIDFADPLDTPIVQFDNVVSAFGDTPGDVRLWAFVFDHLTRTALSPNATVGLIESIIRELS
jgi:transcriptional regulator with XRE-family HTH domain